MVKGETYDKQAFENAVFRHFINIFLNKQDGVTKGCDLEKDAEAITITQGMFCIQGGFLREVEGTRNVIPKEAGYYKLVYEIDLSKTNLKGEFNQGSYKFVKALGDYPKLVQEDLENGGNIYQLAFCQFRITETGLQDFKDIRQFIEYGVYERKFKALFSGDTKGNITLTDEVSKYKKIKIYYYDNNGQKYSVEIENESASNDLSVSLSGHYNEGKWFNLKVKTYRIIGKAMNKKGQANYEFGTQEISYNDNISVTRVEGYR